MLCDNVSTIYLNMELFSTREQVKITDNGFQYVYDRQSSDGKKKFWRCERKIDKCKARVHTDSGTGEVRFIFHCCKFSLNMQVKLLIDSIFEYVNTDHI